MQEKCSRLLKLLKVYEKNTRDALFRLHLARGDFDKHKLQHDKMVEYRLEYMQQLATLGEAGTSLMRIKQRTTFILQMDGILKKLSKDLSDLATLRREAEQTWRESRLKEESIKKMIIKLEKEIEKDQLKKEERELAIYAYYTQVP